MKNIPLPLWRLVISPPLIGAACLLIGLCMRDRLTGVLGFLVAVCCVCKSVGDYLRLRDGQYVEITGTCLTMHSMWPLRIRRVKFLMDSGEARTFYLHHYFKPRVGHRQKLFFWKDKDHPDKEVDLKNPVIVEAIGMEEIE